MRGGKVLLVGGIIFASEIVWHLYKRFCYPRIGLRNNRITSGTKVQEEKPYFFEVMFFSHESNFCRAHPNSYGPCTEDNCPVGYLSKLESYINQSKCWLDICMYVLSCELLSKAIVAAHKRGVIVRLITDYRMFCNEVVQTELFHNNGVPIRFKDVDGLMHHKFVIIDKTILITGSTNWTNGAFYKNFENILLTNQPDAVQPYVEEFDRLWKEFAIPGNTD